jgi:hypothetical protein
VFVERKQVFAKYLIIHKALTNGEVADIYTLRLKVAVLKPCRLKSLVSRIL